MTVAATSATTPSATTTVDAGRNRLAQNFDMFLTLLTSQMKNQDPLSPLDNNQFTAQLVQMTGVEQQLAANDMLKQLVANTGGSIAGAVGLIGKQVRADTPDAKLAGGTAQWGYKLDSDVTDLKAEILDSKGRVVSALAPAGAMSKAGEHAFTWDGKSSSGQAMPDGIYTLRLSTMTATGSTPVGSIYQEGPVTGVEQANGTTLVTMNGGKVAIGQILSVVALAASTPAPVTPTPTGAGSNTNTTADQTSAQTA